jgi:hypothetical protein
MLAILVGVSVALSAGFVEPECDQKKQPNYRETQHQPHDMNRSVGVVGDDEQPRNYRCDWAEEDDLSLIPISRRQRRTILAHPSSEADLANFDHASCTTPAGLTD